MSNNQYKSFGTKLKEIRIKAKESIAEVSGAVEVEAELIKDLESGVKQPTEDIVLLLISHFALKDDDALRLWELAGYEQDKTGITSINGGSDGISQKAYVAAGDIRILYTDMVHVKANQHGVVLNFLQSLGGEDQTMAVSRIGMSHDHAKTLLKVLQQTLEASENPKGKNQDKDIK